MIKLKKNKKNLKYIIKSDNNEIGKFVARTRIILEALDEDYLKIITAEVKELYKRTS